MSAFSRNVAHGTPPLVIVCAVVVMAACGSDGDVRGGAETVSPASPAATELTKGRSTLDIDVPDVSLGSAGRSVQPARAGFTCTPPEGISQGDGFTDRPEEYLPVASGDSFTLVVEGAGSSVLSALIIHDLEGETLARLNTMPVPSPASFTPDLPPGRYRLLVNSHSGDCETTDWFGIEVVAP